MSLISLLVMLGLSFAAFGEDSSIIEFKDWKATEVGDHKISRMEACVASTKIAGKDTTLEIYAEAATTGGYVPPTIQIVTTDVPPALNASLKIDSGEKFPMSISLQETRKVTKTINNGNGNEPVEVEQQVFLARFKSVSEMIWYMKERSKISTTFFDAAGKVGSVMTFSLSGSHKTISEMQKVCK